MSKKIIVILVGALSIPLFINGCAEMTQGLVGREDIAIVSPNDYFNDRADTIIYTDQNWNSAESLWFYNTSQGSDILPYDIFVHLEQSDNEERFITTKNIEKYRYLPQKPSRDNPDGLPVGFVKDEYKGEDYVGFTCAACHTSQINYQGVGMRIDGAPALADMESMLLSLELSLLASLEKTNSDKFNRLAKAVGKKEGEEKEVFSQLLEKTHKDIHFYNCANQPIHPGLKSKLNKSLTTRNKCSSNKDVLHYGYGRLDAVGRIYNRTLLYIGGKDDNGSLIETTQTISPTAPVSYPFLWDTPQHDFVQWNGLLENNFGFVGSLARNTGEVVGVFATIDIEVDKDKISYPSSVKVRNLVRLEDQLESLWSPLWSDLSAETLDPVTGKKGPLPVIVQACQKGVEVCAEKGEKIFKEYACAACHIPITRDSDKRKVVAQMSSLDVIKTDRNMARHAIESCGDSGLILSKLQKSGTAICPGNQENSDNYNPKTAIPALTAVETVTAGVLQEGIFNSFYLTLQSIGQVITSLASDEPQYRHVDFEKVNKGYLNAYKGRPLNGIWATAPYLHNGSVPSLYDLLLPACSPEEIASKSANSCRPALFTVGRREFDPIHVGFVTNRFTNKKQAKLFEKSKQESENLYMFDTSHYGNLNTGHEYAAGKDPVPPVDAEGSFKALDEQGEKITIDQWQLKPALNLQQRLNLVEYLKTL